MRASSILIPVAGLMITGVALTAFFFRNDYAAHSPAVSESNRQPFSQKNRPQIETERDPARRGQLLRDWTDTINTEDIGAALAEIEREVSADLRSELRRELLASWARRDRADLAKWFEARGAADELHQDALQTLVTSLVSEGGDHGFQWMEKFLSPSGRAELHGPFFREWANTDPSAAANTLKGLVTAAPGVAGWSDLIGQVVAQWAHLDLNSAVEWTTSLPAGEGKTHALIQLGYQWAEHAPAAAAAYALAQNDPSLVRLVAGKWAEADPRTALAWVGDMPASESRNGALAAALTVWAQRDSSSAALYVDGLNTPAGGSQATLAVVSVWAQADPVQAAHWVGRFPEGAIRESALEQLVGSWAANSASAAGQWIQQLPATRSRDVAVGAFCNAITPTDPAKAFEWARLISDETLRTQAMETAASAWEDRRTAGAL
ncbi:MAG: hypothetical protein K0R17_411 [Rariglobus sp.]|jgi:DNA-binding transcriptional regulator YbjK|nr:hypothetical protein [Rariglobus sp.]